MIIHNGDENPVPISRGLEYSPESINMLNAVPKIHVLCKEYRLANDHDLQRSAINNLLNRTQLVISFLRFAFF